MENNNQEISDEIIEPGENPKIYIISSGSYSDYSVWGVCSTKELAEKTIDVLNKMKYSDEYEIEEYELDIINKIPPGYEPWEVHMDKDGNVKKYLCHVELNENQGFNRPRFYMPIDRNEMMEMVVIARNLEHAVKIVNEKRAQFIAMDQWGKKPTFNR